MKPGLSLLEVLFALTIGGILTTLLYQYFNQTTRTIRTIDTLIDIHTDLALFHNRVATDITGAFAPGQSIEKKPKAGMSLNPVQQKKEQTKETAKSPDQTTRVLSDIFVLNNFNVGRGTTASNSQFTFISTNPLDTYGQQVPRIVRISYKIHKQDNVFKLVRYESSELDAKKFDEKIKAKKITGYAVLSHIVSLEIIAKHYSQTKEKKKELKTAKQWSDNDQFKDDKQLLPDYIQIKCTVLAGTKKKEVEHSMLISIPSAASSIPRSTTPILELALGRAEEIIKTGKERFEQAQKGTQPAGGVGA